MDVTCSRHEKCINFFKGLKEETTWNLRSKAYGRMVYKWTVNKEGVGGIRITHDISLVTGSYLNTYEFLIPIIEKQFLHQLSNYTFLENFTPCTLLWASVLINFQIISMWKKKLVFKWQNIVTPTVLLSTSIVLCKTCECGAYQVVGDLE
jgi:hypothetical protein